MPNNQKQMDREVRWGGPCPTCGHGFMIRKTKDANSVPLGWVVCASGTCAYGATFDAFREAWRQAQTI